MSIIESFLQNNGIQILLILVALIGGWYKFDFRVRVVEVESKTALEAAKNVAETLNNLNATLAKLDQRLSDFPLHKHINGSKEPIYPGRT